MDGGISKVAVIADDSEEILFTLSQMLEHSGFRVFKAHNGMEALNLIRSMTCTIDLLITDQEMPELKGVDLVQLLIREGLKVSSIILFTGLMKSDPTIKNFTEYLHSFGHNHIKIAFKADNPRILEDMIEDAMGR